MADDFRPAGRSDRSVSEDRIESNQNKVEAEWSWQTCFWKKRDMCDGEVYAEREQTTSTSFTILLYLLSLSADWWMKYAVYLKQCSSLKVFFSSRFLNIEWLQRDKAERLGRCQTMLQWPQHWNALSHHPIEEHEPRIDRQRTELVWIIQEVENWSRPSRKRCNYANITGECSCIDVSFRQVCSDERALRRSVNASDHLQPKNLYNFDSNDRRELTSPTKMLLSYFSQNVISSPFTQTRRHPQEGQQKNLVQLTKGSLHKTPVH